MIDVNVDNLNARYQEVCSEVCSDAEIKKLHYLQFDRPLTDQERLNLKWRTAYRDILENELDCILDIYDLLNKRR